MIKGTHPHLKSAAGRMFVYLKKFFWDTTIKSAKVKVEDEQKQLEEETQRFLEFEECLMWRDIVKAKLHSVSKDSSPADADSDTDPGDAEVSI